MSKNKLFIFHKHDHYALQFLEKNGKEKQQHNKVLVSIETKMSDFSSKFKKVFLMASFFSTSTVMRTTWYVENGASAHISSAHSLFSTLKEHVLGFHVVICDDAKHLVVEVGIILSNYNYVTL